MRYFEAGEVMRVRVSDQDLGRLDCDLAVGFAFEGDRAPRGIDDPGLRRTLATQMTADGFRGQTTDRVVWNADARHAARRFAVLGLGRARKQDGEAIRTACARAARLASELGAGRIALRLPTGSSAEVPTDARAAVEGVFLGDYAFERHLTDRDRRVPRLASLELSAPGPRGPLERAARLGAIGGAAVVLARDLAVAQESRIARTPGGRRGAPRRPPLPGARSVRDQTARPARPARGRTRLRPAGPRRASRLQAAGGESGTPDGSRRPGGHLR
jgi:hypothetical protein